jgi:hypothetical protein
MSSAIYNEYYDQVREAAFEALKQYFECGNYEEDEFDSVFDELMLDDSVTGNGCGHRGPFGGPNAYDIDRMAHEIAWDSEFHIYLDEYGIGIEDLVRKGEETVDVWAACMILDSLWSQLNSEWNSLWCNLRDEEERGLTNV